MRCLRFWNQVVKTETCWLWTGTLFRGYGRFRGNGAHRWAWEEARGSIPKGLQIDHLCRVRNCVRLSHLRLVDQRTNVLCGVGPPAMNARKTHCPKGHDYAIRWNGRMGWQRQCLTCRRERALRYYYEVVKKKSVADSGNTPNT